MSSETAPRPDQPPAPRMGHQPVLDGVRGFAVLIVLCYHLEWHLDGGTGIKGGFFAVDVFFALSGFLITTLLLEDHVRHGVISLGRFFARRFLRLYPVLVVLMAFSALSGVFLSPPAEPARIALVTVSVLTYWSNWLTIADPNGWTGGLNHTWSLAVEMHFYLLWAVLLAWITDRRGRDWRLLGVVAVVLAASSALWRGILWAQGGDPFWLYASTEVRLDAVFLGACAGLLRWGHLAEPGRRLLPGLSPGMVKVVEVMALGLLTWLLATVGRPAAFSTLGGSALAGAITALLILTGLLYQGSLVARLASFPVLVWLGRVSYSLYLWQVPAGKLFTRARLTSLGLPTVVAELVRMGICIALAAGSYYIVERYFLRLKDRRAS